jgi:hypothetical protein
MTEVLRILALILGGLPIIIYPAIATASAMSLAPSSSTHVKVHWFHNLVIRGFLWGTLIYPLVFLTCMVLSQEIPEHRLAFALLPLGFLLLLAGLYLLWSRW